MSAAAFTVSTARPPPTPKITSAVLTPSFASTRSTAAFVASLPYTAQAVTVMPAFANPARSAGPAFARAVSPPITATRVP